MNGLVEGSIGLVGVGWGLDSSNEGCGEKKREKSWERGSGTHDDGRGESVKSIVPSLNGANNGRLRYDSGVWAQKKKSRGS